MIKSIRLANQMENIKQKVVFEKRLICDFLCLILAPNHI